MTIIREAPMHPLPTARPAPGSVPVHMFTTLAEAAADQREAWASRWHPIVEMAFPADSARGYPARNWVWDLGAVALSAVEAPPLIARRSPAQVRRDQIDTWFLTCHRHGSMRHMAGDRIHVAGPGVPILYSLGEGFSQQRTDIRGVTLALSRDFMGELNASLERMRNRPLEGPMGGLLGDFILALEARVPLLSPQDLPGLNAVIRQMVAACLAPTPDRLAEAAPALDATRRERVRLAVRRHMASPGLTPAKLCRMVGLSRSSLYRLFEAEGGVARYISVQRLRAAHAALSDPAGTASIRAVGEAVGFVDAASFSRSFRREFGCTPRDLRQRAQGGGGVDHALSGRQAAGTDLPALLRRL